MGTIRRTSSPLTISNSKACGTIKPLKRKSLCIVHVSGTLKGPK